MFHLINLCITPLLSYTYMVCFIPLVKANLKCILGFIHIHIALKFQQAHVFLIYENKKKKLQP